MERRQFTREFKLEAVRLIKQRGVSYAQASKDLVVHPTRLRNWVKQLADDPQHAFPGHGQMKPEQLEIAQLKREVAKLKAEQDILQRIRFAASPDRHHHRTAHSRVSTSRSETMAPSRSDFQYEPTSEAYHCPGGKQLRTSGTVHEGKTLLYRAIRRDCGICPLKPQCCPKEPSRKTPHDIDERALDVARSFVGTEGFEQSRRERKKMRCGLHTSSASEARPASNARPARRPG
jgi:transposase-like protein